MIKKRFVKIQELANLCHRSLSFVKTRISTGDLKAIKTLRKQSCWFGSYKRNLVRIVWLIPRLEANRFIKQYSKK